MPNDLDAVMERYKAWLAPSPVEGGLDDIEIETRTWKSAKDVPVLVAELRALRPMRELVFQIATDEILVDEQIVWARELLAAYDNAVKELPHA